MIKFIFGFDQTLTHPHRQSLTIFPIIFAIRWKHVLLYILEYFLIFINYLLQALYNIFRIRSFATFLLKRFISIYHLLNRFHHVAIFQKFDLSFPTFRAKQTSFRRLYFPTTQHTISIGCYQHTIPIPFLWGYIDILSLFHLTLNPLQYGKHQMHLHIGFLWPAVGIL